MSMYENEYIKNSIQKKGILRIISRGKVPLNQIRLFLDDLDYLYNCIEYFLELPTLYNNFCNKLNQACKDIDINNESISFEFENINYAIDKPELISKAIIKYLISPIDNLEKINQDNLRAKISIYKRNELGEDKYFSFNHPIVNKKIIILNSVNMNSPGIWEFLANLNPLEVIRKYLSDRHERGKDHSFRNEIECKKEESKIINQNLRNQILETEIIDKKIDIMRKIGMSDDQISKLTKRLLETPKKNLFKHIKSGLIDQNPEIILNE